MAFDLNNPFALVDQLNAILENQFKQKDEIGLEEAMKLLVQEGCLSERPLEGMSEEAWRRGKLILWVMRLSHQRGELRTQFPYLDVLCGVDSPYPQIKFLAQEVEVDAWTDEYVEQQGDHRQEVIKSFKKAFNSYAFSRTKEGRSHLQERLDAIIEYIDSMAPEEEMAIDRARRWVARVAFPQDGLFPHLREAFPRARSEWGQQELVHLQSATEYGMDVMSISSLLRRTPAEIVAKIEEEQLG